MLRHHCVKANFEQRLTNRNSTFMQPRRRCHCSFESALLFQRPIRCLLRISSGTSILSILIVKSMCVDRGKRIMLSRDRISSPDCFMPLSVCSRRDGFGGGSARTDSWGRLGLKQSSSRG